MISTRNGDRNVIDEKYVREFVEQFVQTIIDEAIKQSSKTTWLIHCSERCHKLNPAFAKHSSSYICWTPEDRANNPQKNSDKFDLMDERLVDDDGVYTLPVDTILAEKSSNIRRHQNKCLKPKAIHAFNVFKSSHQKTFSDFKLFLINLYSSNDDVATRKIGSENSAFIKYCCTKSVNEPITATVSETALTDEPRKCRSKNQTKRDARRIKRKTDKTLANGRKCNRERCAFFNIKHSLCNVFKSQKDMQRGDETVDGSFLISIKNRLLPPLPSSEAACACPCVNSENLRDTNVTTSEDQDHSLSNECEEICRFDDDCLVHRDKTFDFASNIEKVKDCGWYWGPMSSAAAEKLLQNERDGSFIVRDSSDDRYIFSLTFKLNALIRHVRIEHGQGNFSFGNYTTFKSHTIVEFIENAVLHSRSGRYLFFLHRPPVLGPLRVQLLYPVSRFKHVQSLQHMCRFVILKTVRRDLIDTLPLPKSMIDYLNRQDYYTEQKF